MLDDMIASQESLPRARFAARPQPSYIAQAYALTASANEGVHPARRVLKSTIFKVAVREYNRYQHLPKSAREFTALREVAQFLETAHTGAKHTPHSDLLTVGHPLSTSERRGSLTAAAVMAEEGRWMSGHPGLQDEVRPLVASAFSAEPGTPKAKHAAARLIRVTLPTDIAAALEQRG